MGKFIPLAIYISKNFFREKSVVILLVVLPLILLNSADMSAPDLDIALELDDTTTQVEADALLIILYAMTAVVFTAATTSYFVVFNNKNLVPRLIVSGFSRLQITFSMLLIILGVNLIVSLIVWIYVLYSVEVINEFGFFVGLFLGSFIFSTIGLILGDSVQNKTLGLYTLLTLGMLDTAFLENPVLSRRYNEGWIFVMPARASVEILLRSSVNSGVNWSDGLINALIYELILIFGYIVLKNKLLKN
ncbi:MAG: hypothetical protein HeimC2_37510 [Candidatus Heimdallarchaeota archaeon LC_2]|nr:MAG: hypothetical protein HeimC2_37510 [Candidatus Heimdallarchaeota archaeon LC_2]